MGNPPPLKISVSPSANFPQKRTKKAIANQNRQPANQPTPMNEWTVEKTESTREEKHGDRLENVMTVALKFRGRTVMQGQGRLTYDNFTAQAEEWNAAGYVPKATNGECLADHPPEKRSEVLKRMKNSTEPLPGLIMSPEENKSARLKWKGLSH